MTSFRRDPYLWIHLAGLASVPLWLDVCLAGLAVGDPVLPSWLELGGLASLGTLPVLWMQWRRPFYIFSLLLIALRPDQLQPHQRQILTLQRSWFSRGLTLLSAAGLSLVLWQLYQIAPIAAEMTPLGGQSRLVGWLVSAGAFLLANLFTQVPATVAAVLLRTRRSLELASPYASDAILQDFSVIGLRLARLLPDLTDPEEPESTALMAPIPASPPSLATADSSVAVEPPAPQDQVQSLTEVVDQLDQSEHSVAATAPDVTPAVLQSRRGG